MTRTDITVTEELKIATAEITRERLLYELIKEATATPSYEDFKASMVARLDALMIRKNN